MQVQLERQLFTVADYYKMAEAGILTPDSRVELLNGEIIKMSPQKSIHTAIIDFLDDEFRNALRDEVHIRCQGPIRLNNFSEPEPDLVLLKKRENRYRDRHPRPAEVHLVIEVSDTTLEKDRTVKKEMYAKAGIPLYWIINIEDRQVEIFSNPKNEDYTEKEILHEGVLRLDAFDFEISFESIF